MIVIEVPFSGRRRLRAPTGSHQTGRLRGPIPHDTVKVLSTKSGSNSMKRVLATAAVGAALLAAASSEASAWVCLAAGAGSSGYGRDPYYVQDAKIIALRTCERRSPIPICTIVWCRPGMR
jgi:hypothetical protein